mgnify:CR=1 FL=1
MFKLLPDITGIVFFYRDSWRGYEEVITVDVVFYIGGNVMANSLSGFTGLYSLSKTLRFELRPVGKTKENMKIKGLLSEDEHRAKSYKQVKKIADDYHRKFIENALKNVHLEGVEEYAELYCKRNKTEKERKEIDKAADNLRKQVIKLMTTRDEFKKLGKKDFIEEMLPEFVDSEEKKKLIKEFKGFTTYFGGFFENRNNMYSAEKKSTSIGYRVIDQNLPKYIDNVNALKKILEVNPGNMIENIENDFMDMLEGKALNEFISLDNYSYFITQSGIDKYNTVIGGKSCDERTRIKGINEYVNLYNQKADKKIGILKPLYKQILSDKDSKSFLPESFERDNELLNAIELFNAGQKENIESIKGLFEQLSEYEADHIYVKDIFLSEISNELFSEWGYIKGRLEDKYDEEYTGKKKANTEKYIEERKKYFKNKRSYSLSELDAVLENNAVTSYFSGEQLKQAIINMADSYKDIEDLVNTDYPSDRKLQKDKESTKLIKGYLDACKDFGRFIQPLLGDGKESEKDAAFYGKFTPAWEAFDSITPLYNKVRNYMTKKPYSTEKVKLNFENQTLLAGWDLNKEEGNKSLIFIKDNNYYLGIMDKQHNKIFRDVEEAKSEPYYRKMEYKLLPGANKMLPKVFFAKSNIDFFNPSNKILEDYNAGRHKKGDNFDIKACHALIDFFKEAIEKHQEWRQFEFEFSPTETYKDISDFYREVEAQGYKISFKNISEKYIDELVDEGKLYLFKIWNKDFSPHSKGTPNLHTLYWKMIFDEKNLQDVVYKLNGEAEVFFRKASIDEKDIIKHEANKPIENKNKLNDKKKSVFNYDLIKDRRYTVDKFQFHVPITLNFKALGRDNIDRYAREYIKEAKDLHIIGIDRGERHLLYLTVIDMDGNIKEQYSLNEIVNEYNGKEHHINYHDLLDKREKEMERAKKEWQTIESIKELKEGYISQVIYKISQLMIKYNAILVLENLNEGFINGRKKVGKQVYQKFEKMMIDKLNYLVDKNLEEGEAGGLLKAYQLASKFESFKKLGKQSGMMFYIPAWNTSNIDPCTGFVNLFERKHLKYSSVNAAVDFWSKFESIAYDDKGEYFKFSFDYSRFTGRAEGTKTDWTVCSVGERIVNFRNPDNNSQWDSKTVDPTAEIIELCRGYDIDYKSEDLKTEFVSVKDRRFHEELLRLFRLVLQMRNSVTGTEIDYMISPVANAEGVFYDSRNCKKNLPENADANGAYNIARKGLWIINRIKETKEAELNKVNLNISNKEWLNFAQKNILR